MTAQDKVVRYRDVFAVREFRAIFEAHLLSVIGDVVASVALAVLVFQLTESPALSAATFSLAFLPYLFGGTLISGIVNRVRPRRVLVGCNLASAALVGMMTIPGMHVAALLLLFFGVGLLAPVFQGVRLSTLPDMLPDGPSHILGRSLIRIVAQFSQVVGYGVGGLLLTVFSPREALLVDAVSFLVSAALLQFGTKNRPPRVPPAESVKQPSLISESLSQVGGMLRDPELRRILLFGWLLSACLIAPEALAVPYIASLGKPESHAGFMLTAAATGAIIADLLAARVLGSTMQRRVVRWAAVLGCLPLLFFGVQPSFYFATGLLVVAGLGFAYIPGLDQHLTAAASGPQLSRLLAVSGAGLMFVQGLGFAVWGLVAQFAEPRWAIPVAAVAGLTVAACLAPRDLAKQPAGPSLPDPSDVVA